MSCDLWNKIGATLKTIVPFLKNSFLKLIFTTCIAFKKPGAKVKISMRNSAKFFTLTTVAFWQRQRASFFAEVSPNCKLLLRIKQLRQIWHDFKLKDDPLFVNAFAWSNVINLVIVYSQFSHSHFLLHISNPTNVFSCVDFLLEFRQNWNIHVLALEQK